MADDRHEALKDYGWTQGEGADRWISAKHTDLTVVVGDGAGWQIRAAEGDAFMVIGHSRYGTKLGDWLMNVDIPPAAEA